MFVDLLAGVSEDGKEMRDQIPVDGRRECVQCLTQEAPAEFLW